MLFISCSPLRFDYYRFGGCTPQQKGNPVAQNLELLCVVFQRIMLEIDVAAKLSILFHFMNSKNGVAFGWRVIVLYPHANALFSLMFHGFLFGC